MGRRAPLRPVDRAAGRPEQPLDRPVAEDPGAYLPSSVPGDRLPYLLEILAIDAPRSLQVRPSERQVEEGFEREGRAGIPLDDPLWDDRLTLVSHELGPGRHVPAVLRGTATQLAADGRAVVRAADREWELAGGESLFHRGDETPVELTGNGRVFTVTVR